MIDNTYYIGSGVYLDMTNVICVTHKVIRNITVKDSGTGTDLYCKFYRLFLRGGECICVYEEEHKEAYEYLSKLFTAHTKAG